MARASIDCTPTDITRKLHLEFSAYPPSRVGLILRAATAKFEFEAV